jgi:hypothetical protein
MVMWVDDTLFCSFICIFNFEFYKELMKEDNFGNSKVKSIYYLEKLNLNKKDNNYSYQSPKLNLIDNYNSYNIKTHNIL